MYWCAPGQVLDLKGEVRWEGWKWLSPQDTAADRMIMVPTRAATAGGTNYQAEPEQERVAHRDRTECYRPVADKCAHYPGRQAWFSKRTRYELRITTRLAT